MRVERPPVVDSHLKNLTATTAPATPHNAIQASLSQLKPGASTSGLSVSWKLTANGLSGKKLPTASTHITPDPTRTRKLLLHAAEINKLIGSVERSGYTLVPLDLHYSRGRVKLEIGLAKGKRQHDKRAAEKDREWRREQQRLLRDKR